MALTNDPTEPGCENSELTLRRQLRERERERTATVLKAYKNEITDWCGFDLAVELVAQKTGISEREVRAIVCLAGGGIWT